MESDSNRVPCVTCDFSVFVFEIVSRAASNTNIGKDDLELTFPSDGSAGMHFHTWFCVVLGIEPRSSSILSKYPTNCATSSAKGMRCDWRSGLLEDMESSIPPRLALA